MVQNIKNEFLKNLSTKKKVKNSIIKIIRL